MQKIFRILTNQPVILRSSKTTSFEAAVTGVMFEGEGLLEYLNPIILGATRFRAQPHPEDMILGRSVTVSFDSEPCVVLA